MQNTTAWIPSGYTNQITNETFAVYYASGPRPCAIGYKLKSGQPYGKHKWHHSFGSDDKMMLFVQKYFLALEQAEKTRVANREASKQRTAAFAAQVTVGTIFKCSWGWEQTNVNFYEVVAKSGRSVTLREVASDIVPGEDGCSMSGYSIARPGRYIGEPIKKMLSDGAVKMTSYSHAFVWNGKPAYTSWYA